VCAITRKRLKVHIYFSDSASEARTRVFYRRLCIGILLPLRQGQGYHSGKFVAQGKIYEVGKIVCIVFLRKRI